MKLKEQMREHFRKERARLTDQEVQVKSAAIGRRLVPLLGPLEDGILTYVSRPHEVNTHGLIADMLSAGIAVYVPVLSGNEMSWSRLNRFAELNFETFEPKSEVCAPEAPPAKTPVLVPGVAFTPAGARLGQGGGHFDRFLAHHDGTSVGLAFDVQLTPDVPEQPHDRRVDYVVTESAAYRSAPAETDPQAGDR